MEMNWKNYSLAQPRGAMPVGPMVVMIHMASVWVPFTSESKEAIADYDDIRKEMGLALKECGRKLGTYLRRRQRMRRAGERRDIFKRYIGEVAKACEHLTGEDAQQVYDHLLAIAERKTVEMDLELDEEGRVIRDGDRLAKDETVFIREIESKEPDEPSEPETTEEPTDSIDSTETDEGSDEPASESLFGDDPAPKRVKKKVKKKVRKSN